MTDSGIYQFAQQKIYSTRDNTPLTQEEWKRANEKANQLSDVYSNTSSLDWFQVTNMFYTELLEEHNTHLEQYINNSIVYFTCIVSNRINNTNQECVEPVKYLFRNRRL